MMVDNKPRVLCVDDQEGVVAGMRVTLRKSFDVVTASSASEALVLLRGGGRFALMVTDMRMPGMSGAELMREAYEIAPTTQRLLLTGFSDADSAILAVNEGHVFRYLTKPCSPPELRAACAEALAEHLAQEAALHLERDAALGWSYAYGNLLLVSRPMAYGRTLRLSQIATHFGMVLDAPDAWRLELASLMVYVGYCGLSTRLLDQLYRHEPLQPDDVQLATLARAEALRPFEQLPGVAGLPEAVEYAWASMTHGVRARDPADSISEILAMALHFVELEHEKASVNQALDILPSVVVGTRLKEAVSVLRASSIPVLASTATAKLRADAIWPGFVLAENLTTTREILLLPAGHEVTPAAVKRIRDLPPEQLPSEISIYRLARITSSIDVPAHSA